MLDYRIKTFLSLAETGSYTETAKKLNISQPAVSQQIQSLQNELGMALVKYHKRKLSLTKDGSYLAHELNQLAPKLNEIYYYLEKKQAKIKVGCGKTLGEYLLFKEEFSLKKLLDTGQIDLSVDTTFILLEQLDNYEIDVAIVAGSFDHSKYVTTPYVKEHLIAICSPENILAQRATCLSDLKHENLFIREKGSGVYSIVSCIFEKHKLDLSDFRNTNEIANIPVIKNLVKQNHGISFLLESSVKEDLNENKIVSIPLTELPEVYFYIVLRKEDATNRKLQELVNDLI